ncbi:MAG: hypothetical protein HF967_02425 [Methanosarcinales archaeon]|nr:hypothetical protein [Methanosarcinales archaeon]
MINILEKNAQIIAKLIHYIGLIIGIVAPFFLFFILPSELRCLIRNIPFFDMIWMIYIVSSVFGIWKLTRILALKIEYRAPHNNQKHNKIIKKIKELNENNKYCLKFLIFIVSWMVVIICLHSLFDFNVGDGVALLGISFITLYYSIKYGQISKENINEFINDVRTRTISDHIQISLNVIIVIFAIILFIIIILLIFINTIFDFIPGYNIPEHNITNLQSISFLNTIACNRIIDFIKFYKY